MQKSESSKTANAATMFRAAHQILDNDPKILNDPVSVGLVEGASENEIKLDLKLHQSPIGKLLRSIMISRSRFTEDQLEIAINSGIEQYVILGAGLDTFAYRQPDWTKNIRIIEVDHPDSQKYKLSRLKEKGITIPSNVTFIPVDFETESIERKLADVKSYINVPTFFSWIAVTQFLTEDAIENTFKFVLSHPSLSRISFTIVLPISEVSGLDAEVHTISSTRSASKEPWISFFVPVEMINHLKEIGFSNVIHQTPAVANESYFKNRSDGLSSPVLEQCICAIV